VSWPKPASRSGVSGIMGPVSPEHSEVNAAPTGAAPGIVRAWGSLWLQLPLQLAAIGLAAVLINWMALDAASGVVHVGPGPTLDTEFIDVPRWLASLVLCIPLWAFGRRWGRLAPCLLAAVAASAAPFWAFNVMVDRYASSGWSQGLEYLGIIFPVFFSLCFVLTLAIASATSPRRQAHRHTRRDELEPAH
jgi:hypothetical protein